MNFYFFKNWFIKNPTIKFKSIIHNFALATPVVQASKLRVNVAVNQAKEHKFSRCPGMQDYANAGYIITAHADIHIKASKNFSAVKIKSEIFRPGPNGDFKFNQAFPFEYKMVEGLPPINEVKPSVFKVPLPWSIDTKPGWSFYQLPCLLHADYLDKIFVYPGIVDGDALNVTNFIFSPIKECDFIIRSGTPLLQVIPFKREKITAECDKATEEENDKYNCNLPAHRPGYYRRFFWSRKEFTMSCPYKHRGPVNE